jgi:hypothetical protein
MALHTPLAVQPSGADASQLTTSQEYRNATAAALAATVGREGTEGVTGIGVPVSGAAAGGFAVTQRGAGANFSVDVAAGHAYVLGDDITGQGLYEVWNDATVNVVTPGAPGSGTKTYRLALQIQDRLSNAVWSAGTYQAAFVVQDTSSTALGNSAIPLAQFTIAAGQVSVTNSVITDYRYSPGMITCYKTADSGKTNTALATDADLQLWGLANNAWYKVTGEILYNGPAQGTSDLKFTFNAPSNVGASNVGGYQYLHFAVSAVSTQTLGVNRASWQDTSTSGTNGTGASNDVAMWLSGSLYTDTVAPNNWLALQWAQNTASGTTTIRRGSWLQAERVG